MGFHLGINGRSNIQKSFSIIHYNNKLKQKHHIIITIDAEKAFDKIQYKIITKSPQKTRNKAIFPYLPKAFR